MATVYSLISLLYVAVLCVSSCAVEGRKAKADDTHHFQTFEISSLLPASVCSPSNVPSTRPSTVELFHRYGPCSTKQSYNLSDILSNDEARVQWIHARMAAAAANSNTDIHNMLKGKSVTIPALSGLSLNAGNYVVKIGLGTLPRNLPLIFDTGSSFTWTQCRPCEVTCYQQKDQIFDPSNSSTYAYISCLSDECSRLSSATSDTPECSNTGDCIYGIEYGDQSYSQGYFSEDKLTITPNDVFTNFLFGCGQNNQGLFGEVAGLIGLGRDPLSLISQTAPKYGNYFSYCLPTTPSSTGHLTLGKGGIPNTNNTRYTPFAQSQQQQPTFYYINLVAILVGGKDLGISPSIFQNSGTIIDSGTVITRLPQTAYNKLSSAFNKTITQKYKPAPAVSIFDTCFYYGKNTTITVPSISMVFANKVPVNLVGNNIVINVGSNTLCLAFAGNGNDDDLGIYGNWQQKGLDIIYDVAGGQLGIAPGGCT